MSKIYNTTITALLALIGSSAWYLKSDFKPAPLPPTEPGQKTFPGEAIQDLYMQVQMRDPETNVLVAQGFKFDEKLKCFRLIVDTKPGGGYGWENTPLNDALFQSAARLIINKKHNSPSDVEAAYNALSQQDRHFISDSLGPDERNFPEFANDDSYIELSGFRKLVQYLDVYTSKLGPQKNIDQNSLLMIMTSKSMNGQFITPNYDDLEVTSAEPAIPPAHALKK